MGKRKLVPAALHAELTQYSSLLRALRTNNTLDVTTQLTQHQENLKGKQRDVEDDENLDDLDEDEESDNWHDEASLIDDAGPSDIQPWVPSSPSSSPGQRKYLKRKRTSEPPHISSSFATPEPLVSGEEHPRPPNKQQNQTSKDNWTRWPLLLNDVPVPEWGFEDEIAHITSFLENHVQKQGPAPHIHSQSPSHSESLFDPRLTEEPTTPPSSIPFTNSQTDADTPLHNAPDRHILDNIESDPESSPALDPPHFLPSLTLTANHVLHSTLAVLAFLTPPRPPSMQNRLEPIGWETVLEAFALASLSSPRNAHDLEATRRIVENVRQRMEVVYGRSQPKARLHSTSNVYLRSPVRIISKPGSQPGRPSSAGGGDPGVIPDGTPSAPEGPPEAPHSQPSIPPEPPMLNFPSVASPGTGTSPPSVPDVETFPLTHRLQIATESRRRLTESLSKFGASTSSLFDLSTLEVTESAKPIPLRPRTRRTTAPKLGSQLLAASSSHSLRKSIGSKSEKSREKQTGLEKDDMGGTEEATEESNGGRDLRPKRSDKGKGKQKEILEEDGDEAEAVGEDDMNGLDGTERRSKRKRREKLIQEATRSSMEVDREEEESNQDGPIQRDNGRRMTKGVEEAHWGDTDAAIQEVQANEVHDASPAYDTGKVDEGQDKSGMENEEMHGDDPSALSRPVRRRAAAKAKTQGPSNTGRRNLRIAKLS